MARQADRGDAIRVPVKHATERFQEILETFRGQIRPQRQDNPIRQWMRNHKVTRQDLKSGFSDTRTSYGRS
jgi:hypothetical protein